MSRRFALLDRDGTIIVDRDYLSDPAGVELIPGVSEGLRQLVKIGLGLIVLTNQSGVGRGMFPLANVYRVHERMNELLLSEGVQLEGIYICPHAPEEDCVCRKPRPGLVGQALADHDFEPEQSFVIGDKSSDIELGREVGAKSILVRTGYGRKTEAEGRVRPDAVADDLAEAAAVITALLH